MTLADTLDRAGLTGRGGAAFSTAIKIRAAREHGAALIVNACDGEIGASKDAFVVAEHLPELVRGARLVAPGSIRYAAHRGSVTESRLRAAGLDVLSAPARYVSSEETSLTSLAQGGLARPMTRRAPFVRGGADSEGRRIAPTVVLNAETLWRVAQIAEHGPEWFRAQGLPDEPGPRLVTVGGDVPRPGVVQTAAGVRLRDLLEAAGAPAGRPGPVIIGGLGGVLLSGPEVLGATWSSAGLARFGGRTGAGVVHVMDADLCPVSELGAWLDYAAGESAGQCGPCMFGLPALAQDWRTAAAGGGAGRAAVARLAGRAESVTGRGACRFPDGVAGLVTSAVRVLADHLAEHAHGRCPTIHEHRSRRDQPVPTH